MTDLKLLGGFPKRQIVCPPPSHTPLFRFFIAQVIFLSDLFGHFFFKLQFTACTAEQPVPGNELQGKEMQKN